MDILFSPFPELQSDRLLLRQIRDADAEAIFEIRSDPNAMKYVPSPLAKTIQDAADHIRVLDDGLRKNTAINWAVTLKGADKLMGMICLLRMQPANFRTEIGYILNPSYHLQGIMSEALDSVLHYAFCQLHFHSVEAIIDPGNVASEKLLLKHGFVKEAHLKENFYYKGSFLDTVIYSLLKSAYLRRR